MPLQILKALVEINSCSSNRHGVNAVQQLIESQLNLLDFKTEQVRATDVRHGNLLIGRFGKAALNQRPFLVTLVCHADTCIENSSLFSWKEKDGQIFGPGVADDKGGIVIALQTLKYFFESLQARSTTSNLQFQFISSPSEEIGSPGWTTEFAQLAKNSQLLLGFEPALDHGDIIVSRHGNRWYDFEILGQEAHSGRAQGEEINAAHEFSLKVAKLLQLKDKYPDIKINIGSVKSERDRFNVVCGKISAKLDVRFARLSVRDALHQDIDAILKTPLVTSKDGIPSQCQYTIADDCPSMHTTPASEAMIQSLLTALKDQNIPARARHGHGASDLCYMFHPEAVAIDGLGPIGGNIHSRREFIMASSIEARARALSSFLVSLNDTMNVTIKELQ